MHLFKTLLVSTTALLLIGCGETETPKEIVVVPITQPKVETPKTPTPSFNADTAYAFIQTQVNFGYRIPNTPEHDS